MRKVFTLAITSLMLFLFSAVKAQNTEILKSFINKNDFVLKSVQKNSIGLTDKSGDVVVKSILKLQLISVTNYETNKELSKKAAYQARQEGIAFLEKNSAVPSATFKLTEKEKVFFGTQTPVTSIDEQVPAPELKSVGEMDTKNPASLNSFITRLQ
ncbi:MAG: hypothetical protein ACXVNQ_03080 [Bacteroidia bacterium]